VTREGRTVTGRRVNEDTYTLLLADDNGALMALDKSSLRQYEIVKVSPMPSYKERLEANELADVFAYLLSLRDRTLAPPNPFGPGPELPPAGGRGGRGGGRGAS
jgi:hypothetical protein